VWTVTGRGGVCGERYLERWWGEQRLMGVSRRNRRERKREEREGWEDGERRK